MMMTMTATRVVTKVIEKGEVTQPTYYTQGTRHTFARIRTGAPCTQLNNKHDMDTVFSTGMAQNETLVSRICSVNWFTRSLFMGRTHEAGHFMSPETPTGHYKLSALFHEQTSKSLNEVSKRVAHTQHMLIVIKSSMDSTERGSNEPKMCNEERWETGSFVTFPTRLFQLLLQEEVSDCLRWSEDGTIVVFRQKHLKTRLLDPHFEGTKLSSFKRKLNRWGFRRVDSREISMVSCHPHASQPLSVHLLTMPISLLLTNQHTFMNISNGDLLNYSLK